MMDTVIDRLYLELSQLTTAKTKRELELERAIKDALKISSLWLPNEDWWGESAIEEAKALGAMHSRFKELLGQR